jgi:hypothetical protein
MATNDRAILQIDAKSIEKFRASIAMRAVRTKHMGNAFHKSVILVDRWIQKNFETEGKLAYPGEGWKPLAESTIKQRLRQPRVKAAAKKRGKAAGNATLRILQRNGWLKSRWKHYWNDQYAIVQSGVDYGVYHDSYEPRKRLPQRKILPTVSQIMPQLIKVFGDFVRTNLRP